MNDLFLRALRCRNSSRPPIWLMRQAGRHLASYRALRERHAFLEMCHEPELAVQVTLLPVEAYQMDAAILFSDILVVPEAMGVGLRFEEGRGPLIERPLRHRSDLERLPEAPDLTKLEFVAAAIRELKKRLRVPLIGFCGAPFTLASYMIEGGSSRTLKETKKWLFCDPEGMHALLQKVAEWSKAYLRMQVEAGVDAIQIFDSWACFLAHRSFREFSLAYMQALMEGVSGAGVPVILFCRGSSTFAPELARAKPAAIGLDWNCRMADVRRSIPPSIALQGNLDPDLLYAPLHVIESETRQLLQEMEGDPGFIVNLGHGVPFDCSEEAVRTLVETVKTWGRGCPAALSS